jgi:hypothetical protein
VVEYQLAVKEWLNVIRNQEDANKCVIINSQRYSITERESQYLLDFLYNFSCGRVVDRESKLLLKREQTPFVFDKFNHWKLFTFR